MIGLVLVSHSAKLAEGVRDLAQQMTQRRVPIAVAGGIDDDQHPIGTDPIKVMNAITEVYSPDGVVILMDLGSALMSAETALDLLDPDWRENLHLCAAPFVEGALTAAVQASIGSNASSVIEAAQAALGAKQQHLGVTEAAAPTMIKATPSAEAHRLTVTIPNKLGIHARPAARIVGLAGQHDARLSLRKGQQTIDGRNINQVVLLAAGQGDSVEFIAEGPGAAALLVDLQGLVDSNLGDDDHAAGEPRTTSNEPTPDSVLKGIAAASGIAIGRVKLLEDQAPTIDPVRVRSIAEEQAWFRVGLARAIDSLQVLVQEVRAKANGTQAGIFEAHLLIAQDVELVAATDQAIARSGQSAGAAWWQAIDDMAGRYRQSRTAYLQGRAADVLDVGRRVLRELSPNSTPSLTFDEPCILAASDLVPSEMAQIDPAFVLGIVTQHGGATSHTAIIARGMGIPAVVGLGAHFPRLTAGQQIVLDGGRGWVYPQPTLAQLTDFQKMIDQQRATRAELLASSKELAITRDGRRIEIGANVGGPADCSHLIEQGAEGVGLFRTELLFMGRSTMPDEADQYEAYCAVAEALQGRSVIIRTLDVGGDKAIPYIHIPPEENPFLGYRGIRYWLGDKPLARAQMRAICRVSATHNIKAMFPMVGTVEEVDAIHATIQATRAELDRDGLPYNPRMEIGIMVEVPSAVLVAGQLAEKVDFFSIGTNDLTQYLMAADRGNARVTPLASPFQPAVLKAIRDVVEAAHQHKRWVGICGEMGGNPLLTQVLIGLGVDELSMGALVIPTVKRIVRETQYSEAQAFAAEVLKLHSAGEVEDHLRARAKALRYISSA
jgi:phosphocarrier protein FPr